MQKCSGGPDPREATPPPPKKSRVETLVYDAVVNKVPVQKRERAPFPVLISPLWKKEGVTVKLVWDGNERRLEKGQPIVIGSKAESSTRVWGQDLI